MDKLSAGIWIAQGQDINVLINFTGSSPLLEFQCGIDLNAFKKGIVKILKKDSLEVQDIIMNPRKYIFEEPSLSDAVNELSKLSVSRFASVPENPERDSAIMEYYKEKLRILTPQEASSKTIIWAKENFGITVDQGFTILSKIKRLMSKASLQ